MSMQMKGGGRNTGSAPQMERGGPGNSAQRAVIVITLLTVLLPPLGIIACLRSSRLAMRAKVIFSVIGAASMTLLLTLMMGGGTAERISPTPSIPLYAGYTVPTAAPAPPVVYTEGAEGTGGETVATGEGAGEGAEQPVTANPNDLITVYAVNKNATLYHTTDYCDGQTNRRSLTLTEALAEGLAPCSRCAGG